MAATVGAAAEVPLGSEGLTFLPYLSGERTPHKDPHAKGAFIGLSLRHTRAHLARAALAALDRPANDVGGHQVGEAVARERDDELVDRHDRRPPPPQ